MKKTIHLQYFAIFREQAGRSNEIIATDVPDAETLYCEVATMHGFTLDASQIRIACEGQYRPLGTALVDGMHLTFIPPVAGG